MATTKRPYRATKGGKRRHPELDFQKSAATYLRMVLPPDWKFTASAAGVPLPPKVARDLKDAGQSPGWSDLILRQVGTGETRWIECKSRVGVLSPDQRIFAADCPENFAVVSTLEHVETALIAWGIQPRHPIRNAA